MRFRLSLLSTLCVLAMAMAAFAEPPGDTTVKNIVVNTDFPDDVTLDHTPDGQYKRLAFFVSLLHNNASYASDQEGKTLYVRVPKGQVALSIGFHSDCSINSQFDVAPLVKAEGVPSASELSKRYRAVLVAWTKMRHGVPGEAIGYSFRGTARADVTLNKKQLEASRAALVPKVQRNLVAKQ